MHRGGVTVKRLCAFIIAVICILSMVSCVPENAAADLHNPHFTGKVLEKYETTCLLEVTHTGNGQFFVGEKLIVNTNIENCPAYKAGDHLTVVFDGKVALSYPGQVLNVFQIMKTDSNGN